jgi:TetR/AcrR family transcriptional repressor of mexJK operon
MTEQLSGEKQAVILDAARKRFAYYGFSKVTMDEIAADVGLGKASLYYYFPTKENLFQEVVKQEKNQFLADLQSMIGTKMSPCDMLRQYAQSRIQHFRELANLRALQFQQSPETKGSFLQLFKEFQRQEVGLIEQILEIGKKTGEFSVSNSQQSAEAIIQMFYGPRAWLLLKRENKLDDESYRILEQSTKEIAEIILNGIRKGN